jgi:hypothetical protein
VIEAALHVQGNAGDTHVTSSRKRSHALQVCMNSAKGRGGPRSTTRCESRPRQNAIKVCSTGQSDCLRVKAEVIETWLRLRRRWIPLWSYDVVLTEGAEVGSVGLPCSVVSPTRRVSRGGIRGRTVLRVSSDQTRRRDRYIQHSVCQRDVIPTG